MIWQCNQKFDNNEKCQTPHLEEENIKQLFVTAAKKLLSEKDEIIDNFESIKTMLYDTSPLETEQAELQSEMEIVAEMIQQYINENAHAALDQMEYQKRYDRLALRFEVAKANLEKVSVQIKEKVTRRKTLETFLTDLRKHDGILTEFDSMLWHSMVDFVTVCSKDDVRFTFKNGTEIQA